MCYLLINTLNTALQVAETEQCSPRAHWHAEPRSTGRDPAPSLLAAESFPEPPAVFCICLLLHCLDSQYYSYLDVV